MREHKDQPVFDFRFLLNNWVIFSGIVIFTLSHGSLLWNVDQIKKDIHELKNTQNSRLTSLEERVSEHDLLFRDILNDVDQCREDISSFEENQ
jgi:hypothetical protein